MDDDELLFQRFMWLLALDEHLCRDRASASLLSLMSKRLTSTFFEKSNPTPACRSCSKNLELIILLLAPLSTSAFTVHSPIFSVTLGGSKLVLTHLIYCRGLGQVPPSGPTANPVVTSFPQTQDWVRKKWMYLCFVLPVEEVWDSYSLDTQCMRDALFDDKHGMCHKSCFF
jgi:hypothetical protein